MNLFTCPPPVNVLDVSLVSISPLAPTSDTLCSEVRPPPQLT